MKILFVFFLMFLVSCAQVPTVSRSTASVNDNCYESIKTEHPSYIDSYEKCVEIPVLK